MPEQKPQNIKPKETADPLPSWNDNNVKRSVRRRSVYAKRARFDRNYTECVYQPQSRQSTRLFTRQRLQTVYCFRKAASEFMRVFAEEVFGIPPEQVIGGGNKTARRDADSRAGAGEELAELEEF